MNAPLRLACLVALTSLGLAGCPTDPMVAPDAPAPIDVGGSLDAGTPPIDAPRDAPVRPDAPPVLPDGPLTGTTYTYVMSMADIPRVTAGDEAVGFDLDGVVSDGAGSLCTDEPDFTSPFTGAIGVDNQVAETLVPLIETMLPEGETLGSSLAGQIAAGQALLVLEVSGAESLVNDPLVAVRVFYGTTVDGLPPALDADGVIEAGQTFLVDEDLGTTGGAIVDGRLLTTIERLPVRFAFEGDLVVIPIDDVRLEGTITATTFFSAEAGGGLTVAAVVALFEAAGAPLGESAVRSLAHPDLDPNASNECATISAGLTIEAVEAHVGP